MFKIFHIRKSVAIASISLAILALAGGMVSAFGQARQLSLADILIALRSKKADIEEKNRLLAVAVNDRGITFALTPEIQKELESTGAYRDLLDAIRAKSPAPVETVAARKSEPLKNDVPEPKPVQTPPDFAFYRNRANKYLASGDVDLAIDDLGKAIELKPGEAGPYFDRGLALLKKDKADIALTDLDKSIELDQKNRTAYFIRAQVLERLGKADKAIIDFDKAFEIDPTNDQARASATRLREALALAATKSEPPKPQVALPPEASIVSVGALNGYALTLAVPAYSQTERRMGLQGRVTVQITLDEEGKILTAEAIDGPKQLRRAAEDAIKKSKFKPVKVGESNVRASGFIVYNFVANQ